MNKETIELYSNENIFNRDTMQKITKLESLPNELLLECFGYLHGIDLFYSFDYLNQRFFTLIRSISLDLVLGEVNNSKVVQFGVKMLLNPQIKEQIKSLTIQKKDTFDNLKTLLSFASLNELSQLRALTFFNLDISMINQIYPMLPLLPNLRYFHLDDSFDWKYQLIRSLSSSTVEKISIRTIADHLSLDHSFTFLTHLAITYCSINGLCHFFKYSPMLRNLDIKCLASSYNNTFNESSVLDDHVIPLERLVIHDYSGKLDTLELFLKHVPNLKIFILHSDGDPNIVNANRWRKLITNTLPLLDVFKFIFRCPTKDMNDDIIEKFRLFQNGFWCNQHHWYTECVIRKDEAFIYTVPYMLNQYEIISKPKRYYSHPLNDADVFSKVTTLTVNIPVMSVIDQYHFPNVQSLTLTNECDESHDCSYLKQKHISYFKTMANLCNITHLEISSTLRWKSSSTILQLITEACHLSSLKVDKTILFQLLKNCQLCASLKVMKKLEITHDMFNSDLSSEEMMAICQTFSDIQEFRCKIDGLYKLQSVIDHLSKLPYLRIFSYSTSSAHYINYWLKEHESELKLYSFTITCDHHGLNDDDDDDDDDDPYIDLSDID